MLSRRGKCFKEFTLPMCSNPMLLNLHERAALDPPQVDKRKLVASNVMPETQTVCLHGRSRPHNHCNRSLIPGRSTNAAKGMALPQAASPSDNRWRFTPNPSSVDLPRGEKTGRNDLQVVLDGAEVEDLATADDGVDDPRSIALVFPASGNVPALSNTGIVLMVVLVVAAGIVVFGRGRTRLTTAST